MSVRITPTSYSTLYEGDFATEAEALQFKSELYLNYHPAGYGTSVKITLDEATGRWKFRGTRYNSCD